MYFVIGMSWRHSWHSPLSESMRAAQTIICPARPPNVPALFVGQPSPERQFLPREPAWGLPSERKNQGAHARGFRSEVCPDGVHELTARRCREAGPRGKQPPGPVPMLRTTVRKAPRMAPSYIVGSKACNANRPQGKRALQLALAWHTRSALACIFQHAHRRLPFGASFARGNER